MRYIQDHKAAMARRIAERDFYGLNTKQKISIMQAFVRGDDVEYKGGRGWKRLSGNPAWNWGDFDYRIKPCERELAFNKWDDGSIAAYSTSRKEIFQAGWDAAKENNDAVERSGWKAEKR